MFRRGVVYAEPGATPREVGNRYFARYQSLGLAAGPLGFPTSDEVAAVGGHSYINFQHGRMYWSAARGAVAIHAPILADWVARGSERGPLGFPVGGQVPYAGGAQALSFEHGALFHSTKYGGHVLLDGFWAKWQVTTVAQHQGLGVPITDRDNGSHRSRITLNTARCCIHR